MKSKNLGASRWKMIAECAFYTAHEMHQFEHLCENGGLIGAIFSLNSLKFDINFIFCD